MVEEEAARMDSYFGLGRVGTVMVGSAVVAKPVGGRIRRLDRGAV